MHSALKHDSIVGETQHDITLIEHEANRVALKAAKALIKSREEIRSGGGGAKKRAVIGSNKSVAKVGAASASSLLSKMRARNDIEEPVQQGDKKCSLIDNIRFFISARYSIPPGYYFFSYFMCMMYREYLING